MAWRAARRGAVTVLTYRRPPENVLGFADLAELDAELLRLAQDEETRVVVLTGGVPGFFVAHADLADVGALVDDGDPGPHGPEVWGTTLARLSSIPQPVVAAIDGQACGGGLELALACQLRVASPSSRMGFVEVADGAIPGAGGTQRLPRLVGSGRAAHLVLSGALLSGSEAAEVGLVEAVLPGDDFLGAVLEWVQPIARAPRHALAAAKQALLQGALLPLPAGLALEQQLFRAVLRSPETRALHAQHP